MNNLALNHYKININKIKMKFKKFKICKIIKK